jgi:hypothetical protein
MHTSLKEITGQGIMATSSCAKFLIWNKLDMVLSVQSVKETNSANAQVAYAVID